MAELVHSLALSITRFLLSNKDKDIQILLLPYWPRPPQQQPQPLQPLHRIIMVHIMVIMRHCRHMLLVDNLIIILRLCIHIMLNPLQLY